MFPGFIRISTFRGDVRSLWGTVICLEGPDGEESIIATLIEDEMTFVFLSAAY